jgi:hypothetical protein
VQFNDAALSNSETGTNRQLSKLFNLSGDRQQRAEIKYENIFTFVSEFLICLNTNWQLKATSVEQFGALKRRAMNIILDKKAKEVDPNLEAKLHAEATSKKNSLVKLVHFTNQIRDFLSNVDLERALIIKNAYNKFERGVDYILAFLTQAIRPRQASDTATPLTVEQLSSILAQYVHILPQNRLNIPNIKDWVNHYRHDLESPFPGYPKGLTNFSNHVWVPNNS